MDPGIEPGRVTQFPQVAQDIDYNLLGDIRR
jgi:hypothetical protein